MPGPEISASSREQVRRGPSGPEDHLKALRGHAHVWPHMDGRDEPFRAAFEKSMDAITLDAALEQRIRRMPRRGSRFRDWLFRSIYLHRKCFV